MKNKGRMSWAKRCLAIVLSIVMVCTLLPTQTVTVWAADGDSPTGFVVTDVLQRWNDDGSYDLYLPDDAYWGDWMDWMSPGPLYFAFREYKEDGTYTSVKKSELTIAAKTGGAISFDVCDGYEDFTAITFEGEGECDITYTKDGVTCENPVHLKWGLPEAGFYTSPTKSLDTWMSWEGSHLYAPGETFYAIVTVPEGAEFDGNAEFWIEGRDSGLNASDYIECTLVSSENATYVYEIKVKDTIPGNRFYMEIGAQFINLEMPDDPSTTEDDWYAISSSVNIEKAGLQIESWIDVDWGNPESVPEVNPAAEFGMNGGTMEMSDQVYLAFRYMNSNGEKEVVDFTKLTVERTLTDGTTESLKFERTANNSIIRVPFEKEGNYQFTYEKNGKTTSVTVTACIPTVAYYTTATPSSEGYIAGGEVSVTADNRTIYFIPRDDVVLSNVQFGTEMWKYDYQDNWGNYDQYFDITEPSGGSKAYTITLKPGATDVRYDLSANFNLEVSIGKDESGEDKYENLGNQTREVYFTDATPGMLNIGCDYETGKIFTGAEAYADRDIVTCYGIQRMAIRYGSMADLENVKVIKASDLTLTDANGNGVEGAYVKDAVGMPDIVELFFPKDGEYRLTSSTYNETMKIKVRSDAGFYTTPEVNPENFIDLEGSFDLAANDGKMYFLYDYQVEEETISDIIYYLNDSEDKFKEYFDIVSTSGKDAITLKKPLPYGSFWIVADYLVSYPGGSTRRDCAWFNVISNTKADAGLFGGNTMNSERYTYGQDVYYQKGSTDVLGYYVVGEGVEATLDWTVDGEASDAYVTIRQTGSNVYELRAKANAPKSDYELHVNAVLPDDTEMESMIYVHASGIVATTDFTLTGAVSPTAYYTRNMDWLSLGQNNLLCIQYMDAKGNKTDVSVGELRIRREGAAGASKDDVTITQREDGMYQFYFTKAGNYILAYTKDNVDYVMNLQVNLPDFGFYTSATPSEDSFRIDNIYYTETDKTAYFTVRPWEGYTVSEIKVISENAEPATQITNADGTVTYPITLKEEAAKNSENYVDVSVTMVKGDEEITEERGIKFTKKVVVGETVSAENASQISVTTEDVTVDVVKDTIADQMVKEDGTTIFIDGTDDATVDISLNTTPIDEAAGGDIHADIKTAIADIKNEIQNEKSTRAEVKQAFMDLTLGCMIASKTNPASKKEGKIAETKSELAITVNIPEGMKNTSPSVTITYSIYLYHNGQAERLKGVEFSSANGGQLTFYTNRFSVYAIVAEEVANEKIVDSQDGTSSGGGSTGGGSSIGGGGTGATGTPDTEKPDTDKPATDTPAVEKGDVLTSGKASYKVTSTADGKQTVSYMGTTSTSKKITVPAKVTIDGVTYKVTSIAKNAFKNNKTLKTVVIPSGIKEIGTSAFEGCTKLTKVKLPTTLTKIGNAAFKDCKNLTSIIIPKSVKSIGKDAFRNNVKLKSITIKSTVLTAIGKNAFKNINKKAKMKLPKAKMKEYKKLVKNAGYKGIIK